MEFLTNRTTWLLIAIVILVASALILFIQNRKFRMEKIEWIVGKESTTPLNYLRIIEFRRWHKWHGGTEDYFVSCALNRFKKHIDESKSLDDVETLFKGFHEGDTVIESIHDGIKAHTMQQILSIAESEWQRVVQTENISDKYLDLFQKRLREDWAEQYFLSEKFYQKITEKRESLQKSK